MMAIGYPNSDYPCRQLLFSAVGGFLFTNMNEATQNQALGVSKPEKRRDFKVGLAYQVLLKAHFRSRFQIKTDIPLIPKCSETLKECDHE